MSDLLPRIESMIERIPFSDCWWWTGHLNRDGYGRVWHSGKARNAHRVVFSALRGEPSAENLDHLCRNRSCVNPAHLEPVTQRENKLRGIGIGAKNAQKTECKRGHPFTTENTRIRPNGARACRECHRMEVKF